MVDLGDSGDVGSVIVDVGVGVRCPRRGVSDSNSNILFIFSFGQHSNKFL